MKTLMKPLSPFLCTLIVVGLLGAVAIQAADAPQRPRDARDQANQPGARGGGFGGLMLDDKQREVLRQAAENHRDQLNQLGDRLRQAQRELAEAILAEKQDPQLIRQKAEAVAKAEVELTLVRAKIIAAVAPTLRPEQRQQVIDNPFALNLLMGGMRGGPGMRPDAARPGGRPGRDRGQ
jgi:Spy/CpxP family protein refolding chaperone